MKRDILVRTESRLRDGDGLSEPELLCTSAEGSCHEKDGELWLRYVEEAPGEAPVTSRLRLSAEQIVVRRSGPLSAELHFVAGRVTQGIYVTPYGRLLIDIDTRLAKWTVHEAGIRITLCYAVMQEGQLLNE